MIELGTWFNYETVVKKKKEKGKGEKQEKERGRKREYEQGIRKQCGSINAFLQSSKPHVAYRILGCQHKAVIQPVNLWLVQWIIYQAKAQDSRAHISTGMIP